ncbi:MAG: hypothetical protein HC905_15685, partial [Bacteroidales bacterium]|nr:hypothetical protein [Bacteroidales bacterium]
MNEAVSRLKEELTVKLSCFKTCKEGFVVKNILKPVQNQLSIHPNSNHKKIEVTTPGNVVHPQLYNTIKTWRQAKGAEIHL